LCDELGDGVDLGGCELSTECRHPAAAVSTCFATVAVLGLSWSRLGPIIA
jgi:hypothetical protein